MTITNTGVCSKAYDPLLTSVLRTAGVPQTDTYTGIDQSESQLVVYNGKPGVSSMTVTVNGTVFRLGALTTSQSKSIDIGTALHSGGNTISVTSAGQPGGSAVVMVQPPN